MKKLSEQGFKGIEGFIRHNTRPLEKSIFNYYFKEGTASEVVLELQKFQNSDGGFGHGIEPDFKLPDSSPMATSIGLKHLSRLEESEPAQQMISKSIGYLEATYSENRKGWFSVPKTVNAYPHASWWEFKEDLGMTVIDYSWGNPTAELLGYMYKYRSYVKVLDVDMLVKNAITNFNNRTTYNSEHEVFCYLSLYNCLDPKLASTLDVSIREAINQLVSLDEKEWASYVPTPLKFIFLESENYFGLTHENINHNLDYLIDKLEKNNRLMPTWQWTSYFNDWEKAKGEWTGILTLEALMSLLKFKRI